MIIVVEGKNDYNKIKSVFNKANVLITNGSAVDHQFINMLKEMSKDQEIVLCLDPDHAGDKIRNTISNAIPNSKHVFANPDIARSKNGKKIGIEHMTISDIKELFSDIKSSTSDAQITQQDLFELGLSGGKNSKKLRKQIGIQLNIGYGNSKQFLQRLNMVNISKEQLRSLYDCQ